MRHEVVARHNAIRIAWVPAFFPTLFRRNSVLLPEGLELLGAGDTSDELYDNRPTWKFGCSHPPNRKRAARRRTQRKSHRMPSTEGHIRQCIDANVKHRYSRRGSMSARSSADMKAWLPWQKQLAPGPEGLEFSGDNAEPAPPADARRCRSNPAQYGGTGGADDMMRGSGLNCTTAHCNHDGGF